MSFLVDFEPKLKWDSIIISNKISWVHIVTPQKYPRIFLIIFIIYSRYDLSQTWVFLGKTDKLIYDRYQMQMIM